MLLVVTGELGIISLSIQPLYASTPENEASYASLTNVWIDVPYPVSADIEFYDKVFFSLDNNAQFGTEPVSNYVMLNVTLKDATTFHYYASIANPSLGQHTFLFGAATVQYLNDSQGGGGGGRPPQLLSIVNYDFPYNFTTIKTGSFTIEAPSSGNGTEPPIIPPITPEIPPEIAPSVNYVPYLGFALVGVGAIVYLSEKKKS